MSIMKNIILFASLYFINSLVGLNPTIAQKSRNVNNHEQHSYIPGYGIKKMNNSEYFQGNRKKKEYFEGWYFKMVSDDESSILSVIPGISLSQKGEKKHAFIQIIDGKTAETSYFQYSIEDFKFSKKIFAISIGNNYFSEDSIKLDIHNDSTSISGTIHMSNQTYLSKKEKKKKIGIMGWYRFVPFMECYHGVVSLDHKLKGSIKKNDKKFNFNEGKGYIEKDWGKSMPTSWVWLQSNNFSSENTSFMLSIANVPWVGSSFTGFLGFFLHNNKVYRFGTYTRAKLDLVSSNSDTLKIIISDKKNTYMIETYRSNYGILKAPVKGSMDRRISESVDAKLKLTVLDIQGNIIFKDSTAIAGLETVGNTDSLSGND